MGIVLIYRPLPSSYYSACLHYRISFHREEVRVVDASVVGGATDHQN